MNDMKEFLNKNKYQPQEDLLSNYYSIGLEQLGLFFWERGGKQVAKEYLLTYDPLKVTIKYANKCLEGWEFREGEQHYAQDFLDCLACLGETKVKELIKELV